jgi:hypothetical protein
MYAPAEQPPEDCTDYGAIEEVVHPSGGNGGGPNDLSDHRPTRACCLRQVSGPSSFAYHQPEHHPSNQTGDD